MIPADSVLHVGQSDYVILAGEAGVWKITEVKTGEQYGARIEVLQGLKAGDRVIGSGAILLKPYVVRDIQGLGKRRSRSCRGGKSPGECRPMIPALMRLALSQRWLVLTLAGLLVALGVWAFQHQQIDAYPDISGADGAGHHHLSRPGAGGGRAPGDDPARDRHAERSPRGEDPLADHLRPVDRAGEVRGGRGELLGPAAGQGEARRGHLARRGEARPRRRWRPPTARSIATNWFPTARTT